DLNFVSNRGKEIYKQQREELELDNFNLLYVALTRPIEQLHIITNKKISKNIENTNYYSGIFINYLKKTGNWNNDKLNYTFGDVQRKSELTNFERKTKIQDSFISSPWKDHNIYMLASASKLWDTKQEEAIEYGNLIHEMMSKIISEEDITKVIDEYTNQGIIQKKDVKLIQHIIINIVKHPLLEKFFKKNITVFNEREIVTIDNQIIIPDRLVINGSDAVVIDYKTGKHSSQHHQQVLKYANTIREMNLKIQKKLLVYIGKEILVREV
ncbi:MAG TPA: DNA helicase UvrD, partial [Tenacibaculum sp.]|nr:DNA helicase UvrD [Tenacibaculum sp.]